MSKSVPLMFCQLPKGIRKAIQNYLGEAADLQDLTPYVEQPKENKLPKKWKYVSVETVVSLNRLAEEICDFDKALSDEDWIADNVNSVYIAARLRAIQVADWVMGDADSNMPNTLYNWVDNTLDDWEHGTKGIKPRLP